MVESVTLPLQRSLLSDGKTIQLEVQVCICSASDCCERVLETKSPKECKSFPFDLQGVPVAAEEWQLSWTAVSPEAGGSAWALLPCLRINPAPANAPGALAVPLTIALDAGRVCSCQRCPCPDELLQFCTANQT